MSFRTSPALDFSRPQTVLLLAWLIFAAGLGLRTYQLGEYPQRHATDDEFHYLWAGLNFWESGTPMAWSGLKGSRHVGIASMDKMGYFMASPALDHPPLFTVTVGALAKLTDPVRIVQRTEHGNFLTIWDVNLARARLFMLPLFAASFWLLYAISRAAFPPGVTLLTLLIYGFMSHAVAQGRLVLADNLATVWLLAGVWVVQRWHLGISSYKAMATGVILTTAAAILTKVPAACQVPVIMAYFLMIRRPREIWTPVAGLVLGGALYMGWILWYGLDTFLALMAAQADRFRGFNAFQLTSGIPRLLDVRDLNGLLIAAWFCALVQVMRPRASALMTIVPVYMLAFTFFAGDVLFGWYSLPLFPWLAVTLALTTVQVYRCPSLAMTVGLMLLLLPHAFQTLFVTGDLQAMPLRYGYVASVAIVLLAFALPRLYTIRIIRTAIVIVFALVLVREAREVTGQRKDRVSDQEKYLG